MDPLAKFLHVDAPPEILFPILELLPKHSLHDLIAESRSRRLFLLASKVLWSARCVWAGNFEVLVNLLNSSSTTNTTCNYAAFIKSLDIRTPGTSSYVRGRSELWSDFFGSCFQKLSSLRSLALSFYNGVIPDEFDSALESCGDRLEALEVKGASRSKDEFTRIVSLVSPRLRRFVWKSFRGTDVPQLDDQTVSFLAARCPRLELLRLLEEEDDAFPVTDIGLLALARGCPSLEMVTVCFRGLTWDGVEKAVAEMPRLRELQCIDVPKLTPDEERRCNMLEGKVIWSGYFWLEFFDR